MKKYNVVKTVVTRTPIPQEVVHKAVGKNKLLAANIMKWIMRLTIAPAAAALVYMYAQKEEEACLHDLVDDLPKEKQDALYNYKQD